jgi:hypothetical protein
MDHGILRKRLSTFKSSKGNLIKVSDDLLFDVIRVWEGWTGTSTELAKELGVHVKQLAFIVRKAKKLHREGRFPESEFKEIKVESSNAEFSGTCTIEVAWGNGKLIRFGQVDQLVDFLKKVA